MSQDYGEDCLTPEELEALCRECEKFIEQQPGDAQKEAMIEVCKKCREARERNASPELEQLRRKIHDMDEKYNG